MKLLHRSLFSLAFLLILFGLAGAQSAVYTVQFKASPNREEAEEEVRQLKAKNVSAYIVKSVVPSKGVFYRVRAGVFSTSSDAKKFGASLQQRGVVPEYFVTAYEKPTDEFASSSPTANPTAPTGSTKAKSPARPAPEKASNSAAPNGAGEIGSARQTNSESAPLDKVHDEAPAAAESRPVTVTRKNSDAGVAASTATTSTPNSPIRSTPAVANNPGLSASVGEASAAGPPSGFSRFRDPKIGYSFDYPDYWTGQSLSEKEATEQRMNGGAMFSSQQDSAFLSAIWNELDKANNISNENDLIVDVILRSMSASDGISKLEETARHVENRDGMIKTILELKAVLQTPEQPTPLEFLGKAVIVRANRGILLVATFYAKDSSPNVAASIDKIIASARAPQ
jgi:hypothetical protein